MISRGHQIENNVYWEGILGYEPEAMLPWIHLASQSDVVLDIGANTGIYSLLAASTSARPDVHAFEPVARIATLLRENCEINSSLRITVHQMAVGSYDGVAEIHDPGGDNCYSASLTATFLPGQKVRYPIQLGKVDTAVERLGLPKVDLVKLDVEGAEEDALDGMSVTLKRSRPAIMLELLFPARQRLVERIQRLMDNGYCLYQMEKDGLRVCNEVIASPRVRNVLLAAQDMSMGPLLL